MRTLLSLPSALACTSLLGFAAAEELISEQLADPGVQPGSGQQAEATPVDADQPLVEIVNSDGTVLATYGDLLPDGSGPEEPTLTLEDLDNMSFEEKVELYNAVVEERDRVVCRYEKPTGSHVERQVCRTVWQMELERRWAQDTLQQAVRMQSLFPFGYLPERRGR